MGVWAMTCWNSYMYYRVSRWGMCWWLTLERNSVKLHALHVYNYFHVSTNGKSGIDISPTQHHKRFSQNSHSQCIPMPIQIGFIYMKRYIVSMAVIFTALNGSPCEHIMANSTCYILSEWFVQLSAPCDEVDNITDVCCIGWLSHQPHQALYHQHQEAHEYIRWVFSWCLPYWPTSSSIITDSLSSILKGATIISNNFRHYFEKIYRAYLRKYT